ncbi:MAG TPA: AAA domain-containing protein, partial [Fibrobacter sp.]|nr:AAA domain-containing protein [Fibrobacter sp.]
MMKLLANSLNEVLLGKESQVRMLLCALLADGHVLIEDVPGTGKTTLAKALAVAIGAEFSRIQFTPDLLPADVTGGAVYRPSTGEFEVRKGPVFTQILLTDEINRASPRTQSALLESMEERQVSLEGVRYALPELFMVLATQNPVEFHGV